MAVKKKKVTGKPKPVVVRKLHRRPDIFDQLAKATSDEFGERLATPQELASLGIVELPEGYTIDPLPSTIANEPKGRPKYERLFAKPFNRRYPFAWWRYADPYAGWDIFLDLAQHVTEALHLSAAWDFYHARIRLRSNFEKLVLRKAELELRNSIAIRLMVCRENGYLIKDGASDAILQDFLDALAADVDFKEQARKLQTMRPSRKALYYRIWALWDVATKYLSSIVHEHVAKGAK